MFLMFFKMVDVNKRFVWWLMCRDETCDFSLFFVIRSEGDVDVLDASVSLERNH